MILLAWGTARCWRAPDSAGLALLVAGYAWEGANFWRALFGRRAAVEAGGTLCLGSPELAFIAFGTVVALGALAWSLRLAMTAATPR